MHTSGFSVLYPTPINAGGSEVLVSRAIGYECLCSSIEGPTSPDVGVHLMSRQCYYKGDGIEGLLVLILEANRKEITPV